MKTLTNYKTALLVSFFIVTASLISFGQITVVGGGTYTTNSSTLVIDRPETLSINDVMIVEIIQHNDDIPIVLDEALIAEGWTVIAHSYLNTATKACTSLLYRIATADDLEADSYTFTLFYDTNFAAGGITAYTGVGINQGYTETGDAGGPFDAVPQTDFTKGRAFRLNTQLIPISAESIETNTSNAAVSFFAASAPNGMVSRMRLAFYEQDSYVDLTTIYMGGWELSDLSNFFYDYYYDYCIGLGASYRIQPEAGISGEGAAFPSAFGYTEYNGILIALRQECEAPEVSIVRSSEIICHGSDAEFQLKGTPWAEFTYRFNGMTDEAKLWLDNNGNCTLVYRSADEDVTLTILSAINDAGCGRVLNESSTVIVAESPEIVSQPNNLALCIDDIATFSVEATGTDLHYQWYRVAEGGEDIAIGDDSPELEIDPVSITDAGDYYVDVFNYWCPSVLSATVKLAVKELVVSPSSVQVTDQVTYTAVLHNGNGGFSDYSSVLFKLDGQPQSDLPVGLIADGSDMVAQLSVPVYEVPGVKTVTAEFWGDEPAPDGEVIGCIPSHEMTVLCEDAEIEYNGVQIQATEDINTTTALVHLVGVISEDNDGSNWDADHVPYIPLCMTFNLYQCDPGTTDCFPSYTATVSVSVQVTPENSLMGTASAYFEIPIGPAGYEQFTVEVVNEGCGTYYCDATPEYSTLLVYIPEGDFVTGGGKILTNDSYGIYESAPGTMTNFGFHVKNNKTGKNLQGGMNIIYRRDVAGEMHNYQIKTNAMLTLGVDASDPENQLAVFTSKANLRDLTTGLDVEGNLRLYVTMADKGEPGDNDQVGFTLWRINARGKITDLVYSSSWSGRKTIERILSGGNLVVHSGFEIKSGVIDPESLLTDMEFVQPVLEVYPNPFSDWLRFGFVSPADTRARIEIYDLQGRLISTVFDSPVEKGVSYSVEYSPENEPNGLYFYRTIIGEEIFNGKVALKR